MAGRGASHYLPAGSGQISHRQRRSKEQVAVPAHLALGGRVREPRVPFQAALVTQESW